MSRGSDNYLEKAREYLSRNGRRDDNLRLVTDTTDFFKVEVNSVLVLEPGAYLVTGHAREGRFGLDDEAKPWVKKAVDLASDERKIIKLVFHENFKLKIGDIEYDCFRSPRKEARLLDLTRGLANFMQGEHTVDERGNSIRILDFLPGPTLSLAVADAAKDYEEYFHTDLPRLMRDFREAVDAVHFLHERGEKHGDVRRDHLMYSREGRLAWIDFDYNYRHGESIAGLDLFGLGNVLAYLVGRGDCILRDIHDHRPDIFERLVPDDMNLVYKNRLMNLKKMFPLLPESLNLILLHFAAGAEVFYDSAAEMLEDLDRAIDDLPGGRQ